MIRVAKHLEGEAKRRTEQDEVDLFGRSAFSRYYYATFWIIRSTLGQIDPAWAEPSHAAVPDLLRKAVIKKFKGQLDKSTGLMTEEQRIKLRNMALDSSSHLATLMDKAYLLRIQADYKPEAKLTKATDTGILTLQGIKSSEAANWPAMANTHSSALLHVAKKLGLI